MDALVWRRADEQSERGDQQAGATLGVERHQQRLVDGELRESVAAWNVRPRPSSARSTPERCARPPGRAASTDPVEGTKPPTAFMSVVFPAPFGPDEADDLAGIDVDGGVVDCHQATEADADIRRGEDRDVLGDRCPLGWPPQRHPRGVPWHRFAHPRAASPPSPRWRRGPRDVTWFSPPGKYSSTTSNPRLEEEREAEQLVVGGEGGDTDHEDGADARRPRPSPCRRSRPWPQGSASRSPRRSSR